MKMWYANESDSRKRNGGAGPQRAPERTVGQAAQPESQSQHVHKPIDPGMPRVEGVGASARAVRGPPRGHSRALGPGCNPDSQTLGGSCSLPQPGWRASQAAPIASSTPRQVARRVPRLHPWQWPPRLPAGHPHPTRGELTRPGVFLRSFSCSPRRLSRGGQPGSLHLPLRSPPFFTSPTSPDLVVEGGARDEGGA